MKRLLSFILSALLLFSLSVPAFAASDEDKSIADTIYQYPVTPGMDAWRTFQSFDEMIDACQIPNNILTQMSTEALIESVLDYPLASIIFAYDTPAEGIKKISSYFNGLQELEKRDDSIELMNTRSISLTQEMSTNPTKTFFANAIIDMLSEKAIAFVSPQSELHYNYTPNGSRVQFMYNLTWADHGITASYADSQNENFKAMFPNATPIREEDPTYNCHSYAWYSTSTGNRYWLQRNGAYTYISDGSYTKTSSPRSGDKVWYGSADDHSAIYYGNSKVTSKWGALGLFRHDVSYCPYDASDVSYWR